MSVSEVGTIGELVDFVSRQNLIDPEVRGQILNRLMAIPRFPLPHDSKTEAGELVARLRGRALFLRNRGGIKSPELMEQAAAALARSPAHSAEVGEWQPIETAPKDIPVIVWDDPIMGEAYYDGEDDTWWWCNTGRGDYTAVSVYPTLWHPMPTSPERLDRAASQNPDGQTSAETGC